MATEEERAGLVAAPNGQPAEKAQADANTPQQRDVEKIAHEHPPSPPPKDEKKDDEPAGGFDQTPLPRAPPGYTIKVTFHRATNLPMADVNSLSSDPYIIAELYTDLPTRHKEDPPLQKRTPTIRKSTDPEWNEEWIIGNVPASGCKLKARIYDEDPATHDDRLGNAHITVPPLNEHWQGMDNQAFKVKKRSGSKRAYFVRIFATCIGTAKHLNGLLYVSVKVLGRTQDDQGGRVYTIGPNWFVRHYSPLLGRLTGTKATDENRTGDAANARSMQRYNFQANQMQLTGPVPWQMYHRFVEFKPFVKSMFTAKGIRGYLLSKALHHQHARIYTYDRNSVYGILPPNSDEMARQFLDLVHYDKGGRIFTYIITLDGLLRFTETGKEFGIDFLSKHTMHSDVSIYIAYSGEFFIRRVKHKRATSQEVEDGNDPTHPPVPLGDGPTEEDAPKDPRNYELVIDNDSGTYRPNANLLPLLKQFMSTNFPGLKVMTLDCQADAEKQQKMKAEQREKKKTEGDHIIYTQANVSDSSISSSEEEALDELEEERNRDERLRSTIKRDQSAKQRARKERMKVLAKGKGQPEGIKEETAGASETAAGPSTDAAPGGGDEATK